MFRKSATTGCVAAEAVACALDAAGMSAVGPSALQPRTPGVCTSVKAGPIAEPPRACGVEHRRQRLQVHGADALQQQLVPRLVEQLQHLCVHALVLGTNLRTANVDAAADGSSIHCPSAESLTVADMHATHCIDVRPRCTVLPERRDMSRHMVA